MLGSLEKEVVAVLEDEGEATIGDVVNELGDRDVDVAYTTVSTVLDRLYDKEMVDRKKEPHRGGSRYVYEYVDIRDEYIDEVLRDVVSLFGDDGLGELKRKVRDAEEKPDTEG